MTFKAVLICVSALLVQTISGQCMRNAGIVGDGYGLAGAGLASAGLAGIGLADTGLAGARIADVGIARGGLTGVGMAADGIGLAGLGLGIHAGYGARVIDHGVGSGIGIPSHGGSLHVTSVSPIAPTGLSIVSKNGIEGVVVINGKLPFLSAVTLDGSIPTAGSGDITYGWGDGHIAIENILGADNGYGDGIGIASGVAIGSAGLGYGNTGYDLGATGYGIGATGYGLGVTDYGLGVPRYGLDAHSNGFTAARIGLDAGIGIGRGCGCGKVY